MYPIFKFVSLVVRLFSRPAVEFMKRMHNNRVHVDSRFSRFLIKLGNFQNRTKVRLDKKLMNISADEEIFLRPLKDQIALEKGIHFFYETLFFTLVIGAATYEGWRITTTNKEENEKNITKLKAVGRDLDELIQSIEQMTADEKLRKQRLDAGISETYEMFETIFPYTDRLMEREKKLQTFLKKASDRQLQLKNELDELRRKKSS